MMTSTMGDINIVYILFLFYSLYNKTGTRIVIVSEYIYIYIYLITLKKHKTEQNFLL